MSRSPDDPRHTLVAWFVRRNPTYLLSAAAMAVGAKLYLDDPAALPGRAGHILLTLGLLQLYEAAVLAVLVWLHRARRSPEDVGALLLVGALFWTGPLVATLELTARHGPLGAGLAVRVAMIALAELGSLRALIGLRLSPPGNALAAVVLALVALLPAALRVPYGSIGTDELMLYAGWWLLAMATLLAAPAARCYATPGSAREPGAARTEAVFLAVLVAAGATHLYAMNHAFFGHARPAYPAPLLAAITIVLYEALALLRVRHPLLLTAAAAPALVGVLLSTGSFHSSLTSAGLPPAAHSPLKVALLLAAVSFWFGAARLRSRGLLHAGTAALGLALLVTLRLGGGADAILQPPPAIPPLPVGVALGAGGVAAYLLVVGLVCRSCGELRAALLAQLVAGSAYVWGRFAADDLIVLLLLGWTALAASHLADGVVRRARTLAVVLLTAACCLYDGTQSAAWLARGHMLTMVVTLLAIGLLRPRTGYRWMSVAAGVGWSAFLGVRAGYDAPNPLAAGAVLAAFSLLAAGATISWHKQRWLSAVQSDPPGAGTADEPAPPPGEPSAQTH